MRVPASLVAALAVVVTVFACAAPAFADGGWQSPDTLVGLVGSYTRPPFGGGPIAYVSLRGTDGYRAQGPYTRFVDGSAGLVLQTGSYSAIANNPAVGAFILFLDDKGEAREAYFILGIQRDPLGGRITALELGDPSTGRPFSLVRVGL
jgi:hypothetical protein